MGCGACGGGRKDVKVDHIRNKSCAKCGWLMNKVHRYSQVTKSMIKQWACPNQRCKSIETEK